jgi:glycine cleavage system regulatory protein
MSQVILTVVGSDRPGLTQRLADAVLAAGGNWLESSLATLGGKYVGAVLVELDDAALPALEAGVQAIDAAGLTVTLVEAAPEAVPAGEALRLELVGQDRLGIVREVSAALAALHVNIDDLSTRIDSEAWSGAPLFHAEALLRLPAGVSADTVRAALEAVSGDLMVDFTVAAAS